MSGLETLEEQLLLATGTLYSSDIITPALNETGSFSANNIELAAPTFTTTPVDEAFIFFNYIYEASATTTADGEALSYSLLSAPSGVTVDEVTGTVRWNTPRFEDIGNEAIVLQVSDSNGGVAIQGYILEVTTPPPGMGPSNNIWFPIPNEPNEVPFFTTSPIEEVHGGQSYIYEASATDADGDLLTYSLLSAPAGASIDNATGTGTWNPIIEDLGTHAIALQVDDGKGGIALQTYILEVNSPPPEYFISIEDVTVTEGSSGTTSLELTVSLSDASDQPITVDFATADGTAIAGEDYTGTSGTLTFNPGDPLTQTITISVLSDTEVEGDETFVVSLSNATNATISSDRATVTLLNDDTQSYFVSIEDATITEGSDDETTEVELTVSLSDASEEQRGTYYCRFYDGRWNGDRPIRLY